MHRHITVSPRKRDTSTGFFGCKMAVEMLSGPGWDGAPLGSIIVKVIQKAVEEREKVVSKLLKCELGHMH